MEVNGSPLSILHIEGPAGSADICALYNPHYSAIPMQLKNTVSSHFYDSIFYFIIFVHIYIYIYYIYITVKLKYSLLCTVLFMFLYAWRTYVQQEKVQNFFLSSSNRTFFSDFQWNNFLFLHWHWHNHSFYVIVKFFSILRNPSAFSWCMLWYWHDSEKK